MKKLLSLVVVSLLSMSTITACTSRGGSADCETPDGTQACFDVDSGTYLIEEGAKLRIAVDSDNWGKAIVDLWNTTYPDQAGAVEFINIGSDQLAAQVTDQQAEAPDVLFVIDTQTIAHVQSMYNLDAHLADVGKNNADKTVYESVNTKGTYYLPAAIDGMTFVWNKTMLDELGYNTEDKDGDNLPDAFDTWEEIFALAQEWQANRPTYKGKKVNIVFPLSVTNSWSIYHALTSGGWTMFPNEDATDPGYNTPEFLAGLQFLADAKQYDLSVEENGAPTPGPSMGWRFDDVINNEISPFGLVGTWMDVNSAQEATGAEFKFSSLPTYKDQEQRAFYKTKGWVINGFTKYPSAAHELLRLLYSKEGLQLMIENSTYVPLLQENATIAPDLTGDRVKLEMSNAFSKNDLEPGGLSLPNNPNKSAMDGWYNLTPEVSILPGVYDGTMTPEQAQAELVKLYDAWLAENNQ